MHTRSIVRVLFFGIMLFYSCGKRILVQYDQLEDTNFVSMMTGSGKKVEGTVTKKEPHQVIIMQKNKQESVIPKASIRSIHRKEPVYDDMGRGISEIEIDSVKTNKNTLVYGVGGGILSFGASFFIGSMAANTIKGNQGTILGATTLAGGSAGTFLFVRTGINRDRQVAIQRIREKRLASEFRGSEGDNSKNRIQKLLEEEKQKQESLRKQREELLKELEKEDEKEK